MKCNGIPATKYAYTEESKDNVAFNLSSIENRVNEEDEHSSSTYFSGNDNNSSPNI